MNSDFPPLEKEPESLRTLYDPGGIAALMSSISIDIVVSREICLALIDQVDGFEDCVTDDFQALG